MATSELSHFCSFSGLCHLQSSWWIKLKPWKPCPPLFGSTVISMTGWQAKDINLNWHNWNYALQTGECSFMTLLQEMITCNYRNGKKRVFREQSSLISGQKKREEVMAGRPCNAPSRENCLVQKHSYSQCGSEKPTPHPIPSV